MDANPAPNKEVPWRPRDWVGRPNASTTIALVCLDRPRRRASAHPSPERTEARTVFRYWLAATAGREERAPALDGLIPERTVLPPDGPGSPIFARTLPRAASGPLSAIDRPEGPGWSPDRTASPSIE